MEIQFQDFLQNQVYIKRYVTFLSHLLLQDVMGIGIQLSICPSINWFVCVSIHSRFMSTLAFKSIQMKTTTPMVIKSRVPQPTDTQFFSMRYSLMCFSTRYSVMCKVYTSYHGTSEIEHGLCTCRVDNPLAKARGLSLCTGAQTMHGQSARLQNGQIQLGQEFMMAAVTKHNKTNKINFLFETF